MFSQLMVLISFKLSLLSKKAVVKKYLLTAFSAILQERIDIRVMKNFEFIGENVY